MDLIINDESITNDRGWRLSNQGCDLARYRANPVLLYQHDTGKIIGRAYNLRIEGSRLIATVEFDEGDPEAREVKRKVDNNFLRGVSPGLYLESLEYNEEYDLVSAWELIEVSIVTIPSNRGALKLYAKDGSALDLEAETQYIQQLKANYNHVTTMPKPTTTTTNPAPATEPATLSLSTEALQALSAEPSASVDHLSAKIVALADECKTAKEELAKRLTAERDVLITSAVQDGRIKEADREAFNRLYATDPDTCKNVLTSINKPQSLGSILHDTPASEQRFAGSWDELDAKGQLATLRAEDPELFKAKYAEKYGK
nr:MAG TPA: prohead protease [Caudoviricetes sp.]